MKRFNLKCHPFFEIKSMGLSFYVPMFVYIFLIYQLFTFHGYEAVIFKIMEYLIIPMSGWWIIYLFYDYFEEGLYDLLRSYPLTHWEHGFIRVNYFLVMYLLLLSITITAIDMIMVNAAFIPLFIQYFSEAIIFAYGSFLIVILTKNVSITIMVIGVYVATEVLTLGQVIPWYHVMFFNTSPLSIQETLGKGLLNISVGFSLLIAAQIYLRQLKR
ncbi:hypothetical protein GCM10028778_27350 [Barrientosiimonas marina]|uniref:ABC transporter permease n=2 Tax=Lentibacillus kimchii TaxID=1542911 RepID=A0ABW2UY74_9BACI